MNAIKWRKPLGAICLCLAVIFVIACVQPTIKAYALEKSIAGYLNERKINYSSVEISTDTLTVNLISSGKDRCTVDDVNAIHSVYTAVHSRDVDSAIMNVQINVYNSDAKQIYNYYQADVAAANDYSGFKDEISAQDSKLLADDPKSTLSNIIASHSFVVEDISFSKADGISGQCVSIMVAPVRMDLVSLSDLRRLYDAIETYSIPSREITQCCLSMVDENGECMFYLTGDFGFGNITAWVSPTMEDSIIENEGPQH